MGAVCGEEDGGEEEGKRKGKGMGKGDLFPIWRKEKETWHDFFNFLDGKRKVQEHPRIKRIRRTKRKKE